MNPVVSSHHLHFLLLIQKAVGDAVDKIPTGQNSALHCDGGLLDNLDASMLSLPTLMVKL